MTKKIYVGNLSFDATEDQVRELFNEFGDIQSLAMINDRDTDRCRGFADVEMEESASNAAITALSGTALDGNGNTVYAGFRFSYDNAHMKWTFSE